MTWVRWNAKHPPIQTKTRWHLMRRGTIACNMTTRVGQEGREYTTKPEPAFMCPTCERIEKREAMR